MSVTKLDDYRGLKVRKKEREEEVERIPSLDEAIEWHKRNAKRVKEERKKDNERVKRSYRLKGK